MQCRFCAKSESAFLEVYVEDETLARSYEVLHQGVCVDHTPTTLEALPHELEKYVMIAAAKHRARFHREPTECGVAYHAFDSEIGNKVCLQRSGLADPHTVKVTNPLLEKLGVDRVTQDEFDEVFGKVSASSPPWPFSETKKNFH